MLNFGGVSSSFQVTFNLVTLQKLRPDASSQAPNCGHSLLRTVSGGWMDYGLWTDEKCLKHGQAVGKMRGFYMFLPCFTYGIIITPPQKTNMNSKIEVWKMMFPSKKVIFRFHVSFGGYIPCFFPSKNSWFSKKQACLVKATDLFWGMPRVFEEEVLRYGPCNVRRKSRF